MGSGAKVFTAGEVLTASDMNTYLASRVVAKQTTAPSASTPFATPEAGSMAYYDSGDANEGLYIYTGTTWNKGPGWNAPWGILTNAYTQTTSTINAAHTAETVVLTSTAVTIIANRTIKITMGCQYASGSASVSANMRIRRGTTTAGTLVGFFHVPPVPSTNFQMGSQVVAIDTGASGSTQYVLTTSFATAADDRNPTSFIVEDIGPSGAPN